MRMLASLLPILALSATVGCAVVGGTFLAFSSFVMRALSRIPPSAGLLAMQSINAVILRSVFLSLFGGTAVLCFGLLLLAATRWNAPASPLLLLGALSYLLGTFLVTGVRNVPRNQGLAQLDLSHLDAVEHWRSYVAEWTLWNHVRTVAAIAAAILFGLTLPQL